MTGKRSQALATTAYNLNLKSVTWPHNLRVLICTLKWVKSVRASGQQLNVVCLFFKILFQRVAINLCVAIKQNKRKVNTVKGKLHR